MKPEVSAVITFHKEGLLAHKSLLSLLRCKLAAEKRGITMEVIATLDQADGETTRIVSRHREAGLINQVLELQCGDLGLSRNAAIGSAAGHWVLICDGDDYLSSNFIIRCMESAAGNEHAIFHPELIVTFDVETGIWWQTGSDAVNFDADCMLITNPWNACSFAARGTYLQIPYTLARPGESGFGFEDWHWNCETLSQGHPHLIAERTVHYVRKKRVGSLNNAHASNSALIPPTQLFAPRS
ncbi:glycosyltransferase [Stenotrophomonas koreensis]|uniref:glycosyltransferase n=1 Tax=Stenotrophomonas koreensis TaxID=266128 RepID=UPI003392C6B5